MLTGFEKIIEERIQKAQRQGSFDNLTGQGHPLRLEEDQHIPEDLRLCHKILKNADCLPPEVEIKKEIRHTEELLAQLPDTAQKYRILKRLNFLIMKVNTMKTGSVAHEIPQHYHDKLAEQLTPK